MVASGQERWGGAGLVSNGYFESVAGNGANTETGNKIISPPTDPTNCKQTKVFASFFKKKRLLALFFFEKKNQKTFSV
jgi:hypothetical protein